MSVIVRIPKPLQTVTGNAEQVEVSAGTVSEMISSLVKTYPGMQDRIYDENGKLRRHINVYVNEEDVRFLDGDQTPAKDGDEVSLVPSMQGG